MTTITKRITKHLDTETTRRKSKKLPLRINHDLLVTIAAYLGIKHEFTQKFIHEYDLVRLSKAFDKVIEQRLLK